MSRGDELSDDEEDGSAEKGDEQPEVSDAEREAMSQRIEGFLKRIEPVAVSTANRLEGELGVTLSRAGTEEENAFQELFEAHQAEIEDLLGFTLPEEARVHHEWWTNPAANVAGPNYSDSWILASRTARPNLSALTVVFQRAL